MLKIKTIKNELVRIKRRIKYKGINKTFSFFWNEFLFDYKRGVTTRHSVLLEDFDSGLDVTQSYMYMPVTEPIFVQALSLLPPELKTTTEFIDFGSGKGRALILAKEANFKNVTGIEFSEFLCAIAKKNLLKIHFNDVNILNIDAINFTFSPSSKVLFFYNPFNEILMKKIADKIYYFLEQYNFELYIIYINPIHKQVFSNTKFLQIVTEIKNDSNTSFIIYSSNKHYIKKFDSQLRDKSA